MAEPVYADLHAALTTGQPLMGRFMVAVDDIVRVLDPSRGEDGIHRLAVLRAVTDWKRLDLAGPNLTTALLRTTRALTARFWARKKKETPTRYAKPR
ncbi:hypothetical protein GCM10022226_22120 [Sphaerisporangium flaviroseum]|uniref:Uncharacterized protein n=1 Tax=Sphaerisporangium flaviroseum TaxID=509199 RepID=A0ABP7HYJ7_9ACTN